MLIWQIEAVLKRTRLYLAIASADSAPLRNSFAGEEAHTEAQSSERVSTSVTSLASEKAIAARSNHEKGRHQVRSLQCRCGDPEEVKAPLNHVGQYPTHYHRYHEEQDTPKRHVSESQHGPDCCQGNAHETHGDH